jgi:crotonobetainyl-CoA:carnitine CoA-transferase CaiB-like acyl-CoA transferase
MTTDGPLSGLRVVELASQNGSFAAKLLADLGADVVVVEPPGGHSTRRYGPFADDIESPERSLWWWYYNTSKRGVVVDVSSAAGAASFRQLVSNADIVVEGEVPGRLAELGLDYNDLGSLHPQLIWISITPFGRTTSRAMEPATDLTLLAGGGAVWNCGYDDHSLPPVRGGGNQSLHMAGVFAAVSALTAVLHRDAGGSGQHVDVSMHAAANVTTESGTFVWLVAQQTIQRQTGRHAATVATMPTQVQAADGKWITTGFPPRQEHELRNLVGWMTELGLRDEFPEFFFLEMGVARGGVHSSQIGEDAEATAIFGASRDAMTFIASRIPAYEFFVGAQQHALPVGLITSLEEVLADPHTVARGFPVSVHHEEIGRAVTYPGAPWRFTQTPWRIARRAPLIGEHDAEVLG